LLKQGESCVEFVKTWFSEKNCQGGGEKRGCPVGVFQVPVIFKPFVTKLACAASSIAHEHAKISKEHFSFFFSPTVWSCKRASPNKTKNETFDSQKNENGHIQTAQVVPVSPASFHEMIVWWQESSS
jgi:hypothetical protein